jgi:hypothetical protein
MIIKRIKMKSKNEKRKKERESKNDFLKSKIRIKEKSLFTIKVKEPALKPALCTY